MTFWLNDICHYHLAWQLLRHESETRTLSMIWETVLTWYLTWHLLVTCCHYDIVTTTRHKSIIILCQVVSAHCSVVSAVSTYLRDLLKEVYPGEGRDQVILASHWSTLYNTELWLVGQVTIQLAGVGMQDMQHFLELVYTGRVRYRIFLGCNAIDSQLIALAH